MRFAIRQAVFSRFSPNLEGYPYFRKRRAKGFTWCGTLKEAHVFGSLEEVPRKFRTPAGRISKRYRLVPVGFGVQEVTK